jgi:hypothetical protein
MFGRKEWANDRNRPRQGNCDCYRHTDRLDESKYKQNATKKNLKERTVKNLVDDLWKFGARPFKRGNQELFNRNPSDCKTPNLRGRKYIPMRRNWRRESHLGGIVSHWAANYIDAQLSYGFSPGSPLNWIISTVTRLRRKTISLRSSGRGPFEASK